MVGTLAVSAPATAKMKKPISVYPVAGTPVASNSTTFSFRGIKKKNLGPIVVTGSKSGRHRGRLLAHSDGRGVSFISKRRWFKKGEKVTVRTKRWVRGAKKGTFWVRIGRFFGRNETGKPVPAKPVTGTMRSRPDLAPPEVNVETLTPEATTGKLFFAPKADGMTIADRQGRLVWFRPTGHGGTGTDIWNFRTQTYQKRPVLTYWKGHLTELRSDGYSSESNFEILNRRYNRITRFKPGNGYQPDIHGFSITPRNTALVLAYRGVVWNAKRVGGSRRSHIIDNILQEVDIKTGAVIFEWHSIGNVSVGASLEKIPKGKKTHDYFHANSINLDGKNALIMSARKVGTVYRINRWSGKIMWALRGTGKLGKSRSDFKMGPGTSFGYQHDAQRLPNGDISLFDNGSASFGGDSFSPPAVNPESSALVLRLSGRTGKARKATLVRRNTHPSTIVAGSQGNAQWLPGGGMFVGWGSDPRMTEYDRNGNITFDATVPNSKVSSYRAYKAPWQGIAPGRPAIASEGSAAGEPDGATVWASWNGASNIRSWRVMSGPDENTLTEVTTQPWENLETEIKVTGAAGPLIAVEALDGSGKVIGESRAVAVGGRSNGFD